MNYHDNLITAMNSSWVLLNCVMGLLPDTQNCELRMRWECPVRFPHHRLQRKPLVSDPDMHHGTYVTHVPWCMSGLLTCVGGENVLGIPGACATHNFAYMARGPCSDKYVSTETCARKSKHWYAQEWRSGIRLVVYSIHALGWLRKPLNLITAPGSIATNLC